MKGKTHRCYAAGCTRNCSTAYLMCRGHWASVPRPLRVLIFAIFNVPESRDEYIQAVADACKAVAEKNGLTVQDVTVHLESIDGYVPACVRKVLAA